MKTRLSVLFYPKTNKNRTNPLVPIYLRVTFNGTRFEMSTDRMVNPDLWIPGGNSIKGTKEEARVLNTYLSNLETRIYKIINNIELSGKELTLDLLKSELKGQDKKEHTLIDLFTYHNDQMKSLVGKDYAIATYKKYVYTLDKVKAYIKQDLKKDDVPLSELNHAFITNFEFYLKTHDKLDNNTAMKYIKNTKKVVKMAIDNEWLERDPFARFKCTYKDPNRGFLSQEELDKIMNKQFAHPRLGQVRDIFIFSCYTGLAYSDIEKLTPADVKLGIDGEKWITINRQKTDTRSSIPLLPKALEVVERYKNDPVANCNGKLLPVISNQKMNAFLKEIAAIAEVNQDITFHMARHTFATTVTLSNNVPIETVSRMLGHTSIKTTQIYSKVVDSKVSADMQALKSLLHPSQNKGKVSAKSLKTA